MSKRIGRPPWQPPDLEQVKLQAARGLTYKQIARLFGINADTLFERRKQFAAFSEAIEAGRAEAISTLAGVGFQMAASGDYPQMTLHYLKVMGGPHWHANPSLDISISADIHHHDDQRPSREEQLAKLRKLTPDQRRQIAEWQRQIGEWLSEARGIAPAAIETTAAETEDGDNEDDPESA